MSKQLNTIPLTFFLTPDHPCPYLQNTQAKTLFLSPDIYPMPQIYSALIERGFRRSGQQIYRPHCDNCQACISVRIPVKKFEPSRSQKRCLKQSQDLTLSVVPAKYDKNNYQLFKKYIASRHADGDMHPTSIAQFKNFLLADWMDCNFLTFTHLQTNRLIATAVFDQINNGLSAVYSYFDSDFKHYSPGKLAILKLIELAKNYQLDFVYLGYWIKQSDKMRYKEEYRPLQYFVNQHWIQLS